MSIPDEAVEAAARTDPEPQPGDGPDYHTEHAAWIARRNKFSNTNPYRSQA